MVIVRSRELLRLVWSSESGATRSRLSALRERLQAEMMSRGLKLQLYEPAPTSALPYTDTHTG